MLPWTKKNHITVSVLICTDSCPRYRITQSGFYANNSRYILHNFDIQLHSYNCSRFVRSLRLIFIGEYSRKREMNYCRSRSWFAFRYTSIIVCRIKMKWQWDRIHLHVHLFLVIMKKFKILRHGFFNFEVDNSLPLPQQHWIGYNIKFWGIIAYNGKTWILYQCPQIFAMLFLIRKSTTEKNFKSNLSSSFDDKMLPGYNDISSREWQIWNLDLTKIFRFCCSYQNFSILLRKLWSKIQFKAYYHKPFSLEDGCKHH